MEGLQGPASFGRFVRRSRLMEVSWGGDGAALKAKSSYRRQETELSETTQHPLPAALNSQSSSTSKGC